MPQTTADLISIIITMALAGPGMWWMFTHDWPVDSEDDSMI